MLYLPGNIFPHQQEYMRMLREQDMRGCHGILSKVPPVMKYMQQN